MITLFNDFYSNHSLHLQEKANFTNEEHLDVEGRKMMIFESCWNNSFFTSKDNQSVRPYLENIGNLIGETVITSHRFINSKDDLIYFIKDPGIIWDNPVFKSVSVWYFGSHGSQRGLELQRDVLTKEDLLEICNEKFCGFPNILYFSSCSLFQNDDKFGVELLKKSGTRGVIGFKKKVEISLGTIIDLLFLTSFFKYGGVVPFKDIESIYDSIHKEFLVAKEMGLTLYC